MLEKLTQIALLYDFYANLLTKKQQEMLSLYYEDNLSLAEIALEYGISRQAVYDTLKRSEKVLLDYEQKLGLVAKLGKEKKALEDIKEICNQVKKTKDLEKIDLILERLNEMID